MPTRRSILLTSAATALSSLLAPRGSQPATSRIRYSAGSPQGKAMLKTYAEGVAAMKALNGQATRSWTFQWYVHATPQSKAAAIASVFGTSTSPARNLANEAWYTCQPHLGGQPTDYFLPWHRLYVLYFEEIIRTLTGSQDFALPYWDYTSPAAYSIPDEFQTQNRNDPLFSVLFVPNRNKDGGPLMSADVNAGEPLNKYYTGTQNFLVLPNMTQPGYSSFCSQLNANLHGAVHVFTGDSTNMGIVPTAAGDPVFWLHHCNVDRIWAGWNANGGQNPTQTGGVNWANTKFVFADSGGARVEVAISTVADSAALPYRYDALPGEPVIQVAAESARSGERVLLRSTSGAAPSSTESAAAQAAPVALGAAPQTVRLAPTASQNRLTEIAPSIRAAAPSRLVLTLKDVRAQVDPNTVYKVFLDLPPNAPQEVANRHYVGLLNFFGVVQDDAHGAHGGQTVEFDITDVVSRLGAGKNLQDDTSVTLVPVGQPAEHSAPVISGGIELQQR